LGVKSFNINIFNRVCAFLNFTRKRKLAHASLRLVGILVEKVKMSMKNENLKVEIFDISKNIYLKESIKKQPKVFINGDGLTGCRRY
jgi:hypothetical protein